MRSALVGVTASGKSAAALRLAPLLGAEILAADAMTLWRGLDVGTAKPSAAQRAAVPHHLLDLADPGERPSVADVATVAKEVLADLERRGGHALIVGGSGLYVRAILDDLRFPPTDPELRARLEELPPDELHRQLSERDPAAWSFLDPRNRRRVVRALEISILTGEPASSQRAGWERRADVPMVGFDLADDLLEARIADRTDGMLEGGWLEECRGLAAGGRRDAVEATGAIGYPEVFALLEGRLERAEARKRIIRATLQLAKRQRTWFRADPRVVWLDAADLEAATARAGELLAAAHAGDRHT